MVRGPGDDRPSTAGRLVKELSTGQLADGFLAVVARQRGCAPNTVRKYRWALECLERAYPMLPRVTARVTGFVASEPLAASSKQVLYETLRDFYRWAKATKDPLIPVLPYVWFSRRRKRRGNSK